MSVAAIGASVATAVVSGAMSGDDSGGREQQHTTQEPWNGLKPYITGGSNNNPGPVTRFNPTPLNMDWLQYLQNTSAGGGGEAGVAPGMSMYDPRITGENVYTPNQADIFGNLPTQNTGLLAQYPTQNTGLLTPRGGSTIDSDSIVYGPNHANTANADLGQQQMYSYYLDKLGDIPTEKDYEDNFLLRAKQKSKAKKVFDEMQQAGLVGPGTDMTVDEWIDKKTGKLNQNLDIGKFRARVTERADPMYYINQRNEESDRIRDQQYTTANIVGTPIRRG